MVFKYMFDLKRLFMNFSKKKKYLRKAKPNTYTNFTPKYNNFGLLNLNDKVFIFFEEDLKTILPYTE